jgi:catechol 2,3-dioxygenase-like lactoylglutathione lyase family enzyme
MPARPVHVVMAAADPAALARFWSAALGWPVVAAEPDEVVVAPPEGDPAQRGQLPLILVAGPEAKTTKNRVHLDLASTSVEHQAGLVERLEELGARRLDIGQGAVSWVVLADPEGNELCVVSHLGSVGKDPASAFAGIGPVAAVVFDCADPEGIAPFWAAATGWPALGRDDQGVWLRDGTAGGPYLDLHRVSEPKQVALRAHLGVAPAAGAGPAAEIERLRALGARVSDSARAVVRRVVLTDPEGNELSVPTAR